METLFVAVLSFFLIFGGVLPFIIFFVVWAFAAWLIVRKTRSYLKAEAPAEFVSVPLPLWLYALMAFAGAFPAAIITTLIT